MKTIKIAALASALLFSACSGNSLLAPNPDDNETPGTLTVTALHGDAEAGALAPNAGGEKELVTDLGYQITLQEAVVNWKELTLVSSGDDPECVGGLDQHISLDRSEDILLEDLVEKNLAVAQVPITGYCSYEITVGPSEAHAVKFHEGEEHGADDAAGGVPVAFHLQGTWSKDANSGTFELVSTEPFLATGIFEAEEEGVVIPHPLHFHGEETETTVTFAHHYEGWLDGIDFAADTQEVQLDKAEGNIKTGLHRHSAHH